VASSSTWENMGKPIATTTGKPWVFPNEPGDFIKTNWGLNVEKIAGL